MSLLRRACARLIAWFRKGDLDDDFDQELAAHLEMAVDDYIRQGLSASEARRRALISLGGMDRSRELHRDSRGLPWVDGLTRDVVCAVRFLRRSPGFTAVAVLSLALGIGANTAIFSLVESLVLRPLPVNRPDRLVQLRSTIGPRGGRSWWSNPVWEQIRDRPNLFAGACAFGRRQLNLAPNGEAQPVEALLVSGRFFDVLGVQPILGRGFTAKDDQPGGGPDGAAAVISYTFWQTHFNGAGDIIGRPLNLNGVLFSIVGVTPQDFYGPWVGDRFDVAVPLGTQPLLDGRNLLTLPANSWLAVMARLNPGERAAAATAALQAAQPAIRQATLPPNWRPQDLAGYLRGPMVWRPAPAGAASPVRDQYQAPLLALMAVVTLVLLIACVNLANLLLARADARRHELGVRVALGASRTQLVRQLLIESLLLSLAGGFVGLAFAAWGSRLIVSQLTTFGVHVSLNLPLDWTVLGFTAGVSILVALLFGVMPAVRATGVRPHEVIDQRPRQMSDSKRRAFGGLVAVQVALCLVLLIGAGLFLGTFIALAHPSPGFDEASILVANLNAGRMRGGLTADVRQAVLSAVQSAPGVKSAAWSVAAPLDNLVLHMLVENPPGVVLPQGERLTDANAIGPGWLAAMGTPVVMGRDFSQRDANGAPRVALVSQAFAKRFFPAGPVIGRTIAQVAPPGLQAPPPMMIVGVVRDAVYGSLRDDSPPTVYIPLAQSRSAATSPALTLVAQAQNGPATAIVRDVASAISAAGPNVQFTFHTMDDLARESTSTERVLAMLSGFFGALALLLAAVGLYGVVSYNVNRRRTEIGIRKALGAQPGSIVRMVLNRISLAIGVGLAAGAVLSLWVARFVKVLLYGLQPDDPLTLTGAIVVLAAVGLVAAWLPARRAAQIDPMEALREQ